MEIILKLTILSILCSIFLRVIKRTNNSLICHQEKKNLLKSCMPINTFLEYHSGVGVSFHSSRRIMYPCEGKQQQMYGTPPSYLMAHCIVCLINVIYLWQEGITLLPSDIHSQYSCTKDARPPWKHSAVCSLFPVLTFSGCCFTFCLRGDKFLHAPHLSRDATR